MTQFSYAIALNTLIKKEINRFLRIWPQTLLPPAITMTLYFIIFGNLVGSQLGAIKDFSYMQYLAPGLIMMSVVMNSYANVASSFYSARFQKSIEELLVSPMPNWLILFGYITGGIIRGIFTGVIIGIISLFFTNLHVFNLFITIGVILLTATLFSLTGFLNGLYAQKFDDISVIPTFILTPLTYFGGVFYSLDMLSPLWRKISLFNPILYIINTFRYGILGTSDINIYAAIAIILAVIALLIFLNIRLLNKGVGIRT